MVKWQPTKIQTKIKKNADQKLIIGELVRIIYGIDLATNKTFSNKKSSKEISILEKKNEK